MKLPRPSRYAARSARASTRRPEPLFPTAMDLEQFKRVEEIFEAAAGLPEDQRDDYVAAACAGDDALRQRVMRMLSSASCEFVCDELRTTAGMARGADAGTAAAAVTAALDDLSGRRIGPYEIIELIGEGGFGAVYRAQQQSPVKRMVALKIIKLGMDTAQVIARFEAERQALALMDHPHIARVFDAGVAETGRPYFVMELVGGVPITRFCDQRCMPIDTRLELFMQVCMAVQHAHSKGVIHRDLKPSNILVSERDGLVSSHIIDFGIAKATRGRLTDHTALTEFRQFIGTPQYMSPEQAGAGGVFAADVDTRSDVYSLGVLLHELMVGVTPFDLRSKSGSKDSDLMQLIREHQPRKPSTHIGGMDEQATEVARLRATEPRALRRRLRGDLDWIILKAMEKQPSRRYDTAADLAHEIERYLHSQPVSARPPGVLYLAGKFVRRHRVSVAAAAAIMLALVIGLIAAITGLREANLARASQQVALQTAQQRLWESLLAEARAARSSNDIGRRFQSLAAISRASAMWPSEELRNEAIASMALDGFAVAATISTSSNVSARGLRTIDRIADAAVKGEIIIRSAIDGSEITRLATPPMYCWVMIFSHDGSHLAAKLHDRTDHARFIVWNVDTGSVVLDIERTGSSSDDFTLCEIDSQPLIAISRDRRHIDLFSLHDGSPVHSFDATSDDSAGGRGGGDSAASSLGAIGWLGSDHSGSVLAITYPASRSIALWSVPSGECLLAFDAGVLVRRVVFTPAGDQLIGCGQDFRLHAWRTDTGEPIRTFDGHQGDPVYVYLNPDATILATTAWDDTSRLWDVSSGREIVTPLLNASVIGFGDALVTNVGWQTTIWRHQRSDEFRRITPSEAITQQSRISLGHAGSLLAVAAPQGIMLMDAGSGKEIARLSDRPAMYARIAEYDRAVLGVIDSGLWRWPIEKSDDRIIVGEGQRLLAHTGIRDCVFDARQQRLALMLDDSIEIYAWPERRLLLRLPGFPGLNRSISIDPTGRWLFTGNWRGEGARVWDLERGEAVRQFIGEHVNGMFHPSGEELLVSTGHQYERLAVGSWRTIEQWPRNNLSTLAGTIAFSSPDAPNAPDARTPAVLAITHSRFEIHLHDANTGDALGRFAAPEPAAISSIALSADASTLAAVTTVGDILIWDLDRIHSGLEAIGLGWLTPQPYAP